MDRFDHYSEMTIFAEVASGKWAYFCPPAPLKQARQLESSCSIAVRGISDLQAKIWDSSFVAPTY